MLLISVITDTFWDGVKFEFFKTFIMSIFEEAVSFSAKGDILLLLLLLETICELVILESKESIINHRYTTPNYRQLIESR